MPHVILEVTDNIQAQFTDNTFFKAMHQVLVETANAREIDCKSRLICHQQYHVADGSPEHALAHVVIYLMPGRTDETIQKLAEQCLSLLRDATQSVSEQVQYSVLFEILPGDRYFKG